MSSIVDFHINTDHVSNSLLRPVAGEYSRGPQSRSSYGHGSGNCADGRSKFSSSGLTPASGASASIFFSLGWAIKRITLRAKGLLSIIVFIMEHSDLHIYFTRTSATWSL